MNQVAVRTEEVLISVNRKVMDNSEFAEIMSRYINEAGWDPCKVAAMLKEEMEVNDRLYRYVTYSSVEDAIWRLIRKYVKRERGNMWDNSTKEDQVRTYERIVEHAQDNFENLMNFPLPIKGLPRLAHATKEQVLEAAQFYMKQAKTMTMRGQWLMKIYEAMTSNKKTVSKQLGEQDLLRMFQESVE